MKSLAVCSLAGLSALMLALSGAASAADRHAGAGDQRFAGPPEQAARAYIATHAPSLGLRGIALAYTTQLGATGYRTVRFAQTYAGLPVFDSAVAVRVGPQGQVSGAVVDVDRSISTSAAPSIDEATARAILAGLTGLTVGPDTELQLGILRRRSGGGTLVWRADLLTTLGAVRYHIDAHTGAVMKATSLARDVLGRVYPINPVQSVSTSDKELLHLTQSTPQVLAGRAGRVFRHVSGDGENPTPPVVVDGTVVAPDTNGDFLFDPATNEPTWDDSFAEVNAYFHLDRMNTFFRDTLKVDFESNGNPLKYTLMAVVNYGPPQHKPFDNAFFTPYLLNDGTTQYKNAIFIGQSAAADLAYDSDVFLHEYTHYVNQNAIGFSNGPFEYDDWGLATMPGSMDEGTADYFSCTVNNDPVVGEASLEKLSQRDLSQYSGKCPDSLFGEPHEDGRLIGRASWEVRAAIGNELADTLLWDALSILSNGSSFGDWASNVIQVATEMKTQGKITDANLQQISQVMHDRGLDDCARSLEVSPTKSRKTNVIGFDLVAQYMGGTCEQIKVLGITSTSLFQFMTRTSASDTQVRFKVDFQKLSGTSSWDWDIYVRRHEPVTFSSTMYTIAPDSFDYKVEHITKTSGELLIDADSQPAFNPGQTYYLVLVHRNCPTGRATISVATDLPVEAGVDAPSEAEGFDAEAGGADVALEDAPIDVTGITPSEALPGVMQGAGCSCKLASTRRSDAAGLLGLLLAAMLGVRRRRRESPGH
jgi:MYXO-CTERM domain-containing protein